MTDPVEAGHGLYAFVAILASGGVSYVRDLHGSIRQLLGHGGLEAALREERARAKAELFALAVIADGVVTDDERAALEAFATNAGLDAAAALDAVASLRETLRDPIVLRATIAKHAEPLDADDRIAVFVAAKNLAHRDSRAWPEAAGYRGAMPTPEGLVAAFRDALGIEPAP